MTTDTMGPRGAPFHVRRLSLCLLAVAATSAVVAISPGCQRSTPPPPATSARADSPPRVVFVGLDGADWQLLDTYLERGLMPNLQALLAGGQSGVLHTESPPLSPLVWTTMMTGVGPLAHRILDFTRFHPGSGSREPITSDERRAPAVWNMASARGAEVAVFGLWATWPAETIHGLLVSDRLFAFQNLQASPPPGVVFPAAQERWARETLAESERAVDLAELQKYFPWLDAAEYARRVASPEPWKHPVSALRRILIETRVYHALASDWLRQHQPRVAIVYFQGTDTIGHLFAPFVPPRQAQVTAEEVEHYGHVPELYFHEIDRLLGEYRGLAERSGARLVLASDHGFLWGEGRPTSLSSVAGATAAKWHREDGIYVLYGPGITAGAASLPRHPRHPLLGSVRQVGATLLALAGLPPGRGMAEPPLPGAPPPVGDEVDYAASWRPAPAPVAPLPAASREPADEKEALAKLVALGYIGGGEASVAPAAARAAGSTRTAASFNNEGLILEAEGRASESIASYRQALRLDPAYLSAAWNLSNLLFERGEDLDRADDLLVKAFAAGLPEGQRLLIGRAVAYQRSARLSRSVALLEGAVAARPEEPELRLFRGRYRIEAGNCRGAAEDFGEVTRRQPASPPAWASLGLAELCLGDAAGARRALERSLALDPDQPAVRAQLAQLR